MILLPGDPAPLFYARSNGNPQYGFATAAGRNLVLTFVGAAAAHAASLQALAASPLFDDEHASLFIVTPRPQDEAALPLRLPGIRAFFDEDGAIAAAYGLDNFAQRPFSVIISQRLQVIGLVAAPETDHAARVLGVLEKLPHARNLPPILSHPPVLIIPHVFEPELCRTLIEGYKAHGGAASGFMRDVEGRTVEIRDARHKVRRDWNIEDEKTDLLAVLQNRFKRRVVPEILKGYQFDATRMERYLVACYDAGEGGHFRPHRDNTTRGTAHRRFACSLNLNAEDYDGGDLRFPEFGSRTYRPPTGGACVFSCSLLHEATPITRGTRYAFLPFLYDEAARKIRDENLKFVG